MEMEDAPLGISMYSKKEATGLCRGQQCSFMGGFVKFDTLDGVKVVSEFLTGHEGQV